MQTEVKLRDREPVLVLSKIEEVHLSQIGRVIGVGLGEAYGYLGARRVVATAEPFVVYHGMPGPTDLPFEVELCVPIPREIEPPTGWTCRTLPGGSFASVVHIGSYDTIGAAYDILEDWVSTHGLTLAGPPREVYLSEPSTPAAEIRTVVEFPVERALVTTAA